MKGNYEQPIIKTSSDIYFEQVYAGRDSGRRPGGGGWGGSGGRPGGGFHPAS